MSGSALPEYKVLTAGDTALVIEFGDRIDRRLSAYVLALARRLAEARIDGIVETVPTFRSLMIHFDPLAISAAALVGRIGQLMMGLSVAEPCGRAWRLPACYDPTLAPDFAEVAERCGLAPAQLVELHAGVTYHVYMLGFLPGFAYMGDLPAELVLARRESPRPKVPAGSVAIATTMSCVFPRESPSGWHVIARSPVSLWQGPAPEPAGSVGAEPILAPGDKVTFVPVSLREYETLLAQAQAAAHSRGTRGSAAA